MLTVEGAGLEQGPEGTKVPMEAVMAELRLT